MCKRRSVGEEVASFPSSLTLKRGVLPAEEKMLLRFCAAKRRMYAGVQPSVMRENKEVKRMLKKIFRSSVSLLLVACLMLGMSANGLAALMEETRTSGGPGENSTGKTLNYVSLGDSMTNGYGLPGYGDGGESTGTKANSGVEDYGTGSYANQFVKELENQGYAVDHAQLAMSGIRTEDIHWLLELDYNNPEAIAMVNKAIENNSNWSAVADEWNAYFGCGDFWTVDEICNHSRTDWTVKGIINSGYSDFPATYGDGATRSQKVALIAKYFQEHVTEADIISLSVANGNIGVFGFGRILETIGFSSTDTYKNYNYEDVLRECEPAMREQLKTMIGELKPLLQSKIANEDLQNVALYIAVSLVMNYAGTLEAILQLNPDAEIILVPVMNTFSSENAEGVEGTTLGDLMGLVVDPINKYIAGLPTYMQTTNNEVYKDATFYYAEPGYIACVVDTYKSPLDGTVRDRFVESIVGDDGDGMIWGMLGGMVKIVTTEEVVAYEAMTDAQKLAYAADDADKAKSIAIYLAFENAIIANKLTAVTLESVMGLGSTSLDFEAIMEAYNAEAAEAGKANLDTVVAFMATASGMDENVITALLGDEAAIKALAWEACPDHDSFLGNTGHMNIEDVLACDICMNQGGHYYSEYIVNAYNDLMANPVYGVVALQSEGLLTGAEVKTLYEGECSDDTIYSVMAGKSDGMLDAAAVANLDSAGVYPFVATMLGGIMTAEAIKAEYEAGGANLPDGVYGRIYALLELYEGMQTLKGMKETFMSNVETAAGVPAMAEGLCTLLVTPDVLGNVVAESELKGLLALFGRCVIGNGIGSHPAQDGHNELARAVIAAYGKHTAKDETVENLTEAAKVVADLVVEYYDEAYAYGYQYALENGYIDVTVDAIDEAIAAIEAIDLSVAGMTAELEAEVAAELAAIVETLEAAKALILEADVLDQASLEALLAMLNEAAEAAEALLPVLNQAGVDINNLVIIPAINAAIEHTKTVVIPAAIEAAEIIAKKANEQIIIALGNAYDYLVNAIVTVLPQIDEALYNYLYNNPEEVIAFFATYGPCMVELMGEYGGEVLAVVAYALYTYGPDLAAYVIENPEVILANLSTWVDKYGDRTVALLQVYAEALGLCDAVREQIAELEKELAELEKELNNKIAEMEKELADLYEQLETAVGEKKAEIEAKIAALEAEIAALKASLEAKIAEVKAAIAELKAALQEAIDSGLTKLENLKDAIANLDDKIAELIDVAEKAALGEIRKAIEAIESAMKQLDEAIADLTGEVYGELKAALKELAFYVADEIVEAVKKYFPELADAIYNYLYNNPEEVIEFVKTYGPYLLEIAEEYGDEALAVVGYIFYMYGDEIAAYVIENHDTILTGLVEWFEVHGENTAELIQVYAEALGWCDAVRDQIAELEATLNELYAALENATGEAKEAIEAEIAKVEAAIAELKAELEALIDEINAIIADVNATVEEAIANVKAAIEELKEAVAELKAEVEKLLEEVKVAIKNEIDSVIEAVVAELEELLNKQIETLEDVVDALEEAVLKSVEELKAIVDQLVYDATHADYEIDMDSYYLAIGSDPEFAKLLAQALGLDKRYGVTDWDNVDYESILKADLITLSYNENQLSNFAFNQAFGYVADYVNVDFRNSLVAYVVETMKEVLPKMLPALSDAAINEYVAIVSAQINGTIDQLSAEYFGDATAAEMDWTTIVGSDNLGYVDAARDEMKNAFLDAGVPETYAYQIPVLDYLYENLEMLGELGELMAMFDKEIVYEMFGERANYTMEIPVADALTFAGESYAFGYAQFNVQYAETVLTINKINPDAILVLLGHYNAFQGIEFEVNGTSVNLGNIYGNFANVTSAHSFAYALLQENTIFVDISDAETVFGAYGTESETSVMDFVNAYLSDSTITSVSEAGHEYIKEQILNALNVTRKLLGDVDGDGDVDNLDAMMVLQYDAMLITKDDLDLSVGDVDGDGDVDNVDAMLILQFDAELISAFPAEN